MGMPLLAEHHWTPEELLALPWDGQRHECIDGVHVLTPSPSEPHQSVVTRLLAALIPYVDAAGLGNVYTSPADLRLTTGALVQPDIFVVPANQTGRGWEGVRSPLLVIEILSPGTARYDRGLKRHYYQSAPVGEFWIVDAEARLVERWLPSDERPEICSGSIAWRPSLDKEPLTIDLPALFRKALFDETGADYRP